MTPWWPPKDGRQFIIMLLQAGGGVAFTAFSGWIVWSFMYDPWPAATAPARIRWLGWGLLESLGIASLALLLLGSVKRAFEIGKGGLKATGDNDEQSD